MSYYNDQDEYAFDIETYDESLCPFCGSSDIDLVDWFDDSSKKHCCDCEEDFIVWYDDLDHETPVDVTDGNNRPL